MRTSNSRPFWGLCIVLLLIFAGNAERFSLEFFQQVKDQFGEEAVSRFKGLQKLINLKELDEQAQLKAVNDFYNKVEFVEDSKHWNQRDYWATPMEFLGTNGGDCEDFTIAKYFTLRLMGMPDEKLRLAYVKAVKINQAHMVLLYFENLNAEPYILDNIEKELKPASKRPDLEPVYSFNGESLWLSKERTNGVLVGSSSKIDLWKSLTQRIQVFDPKKESEQP